MRRTDIPVIDAASRPYWQAAREGRLLVAECGSCRKLHHYPRPFCPYCWSDEVRPQPVSGQGTVYTYSIVHVNDMEPFRQRLPYVAAIVELAEGPRVMTLIEGVDPARLSVGMAVTAFFRPIDPDDPESAYITVFTSTRERS